MFYFVVTFVVFIVFFLVMAIGLLQRKPIKGSCGGLKAVGIEKECDCPEPCDARKERMRLEEEKIQRAQRIDVTDKSKD